MFVSSHNSFMIMSKASLLAKDSIKLVLVYKAKTSRVVSKKELFRKAKSKRVM